MSDPRNDRIAPAPHDGGEPGCLPPGHRLHEFVIDAVLGEGGFGVVYAATDTRLERRVAIKEYMPTTLATRDASFSVHPRSSADHREAFVAGLRSFVNEAKLLARFEHPALVKVYQFWEERGTAYMVMPLYSAPTFKRWIRQGTKPVDEAWLLGFLDGLIDALDVLHRENCLHRDVAPDNILVLNDTSPVLLDFGAARRVIGDLTHDLTVILKPGFAPVEQYAETSALKQGPWTDVYALSAVGYFAITGKAPVASVGRMVSDELVPLRELAAGRYSPRLLAALDAGLRVRPEERPPSMQSLRGYLFGDAEFEKTTVIVERPAAALPPAPPALHSTFKPGTDAPAAPPAVTHADEEPTRRMARAPAHASETTVAASAAPTVRLPSKTAAAEPAASARRPDRKAGALLWAGGFAAGGAALVFGAAWLLDRAPQTPAPVAKSEQAVPAAVSVAPTAEDASRPSAPAASPAMEPPPAAQSAAPAASPIEPAPPAAKATLPAAAPAEKKAPPVAARRSSTERIPARTAEAPKPIDAAKPADAPKAVDPPKPPQPAPGLRAPEGPPPLAVNDRGLVELHVDGAVDPAAREPLFSAYTCCNLHYSGDWVSDLNYSGDIRIPAGSPIKVVDYGRWRLITEVGGKRIRIGLDYGRRHETLAQFARKLTVDKDLRFRLAAFPPIVQDAIRAAKVMPGMTKEQVLIAVGFPARHETPSIDAAEWKMWHTSRIPYTIQFDERGRVRSIEIDDAARPNVVYGAKP